MNEPSPSAPSGSFRIGLAYEDAEILSIARIQARKYEERFGGSSLGIVATGVLVAFAGAEITLVTQTVARWNSSFIAVLIFLAFWLGVWSMAIWRWIGRRNRKWLRFRQEMSKGAVLLVTSAGIALRMPGLRAFYARSQIISVTRQAGLVVLWTRRDSGIAVPERLVDPEQLARLLALPEKSGEERFPTPPAPASAGR